MVTFEAIRIKSVSYRIKIFTDGLVNDFSVMVSISNESIANVIVEDINSADYSSWLEIEKFLKGEYKRFIISIK